MDLLDTLIRFFTENGYVAVFVVLMICGFGVPIPEDITLVAGGVIAGLGYANVHVMCAVGLFGVLWLVVYYIAGHLIPFMSDLGGWNVLIGMGCMAAAFGLATLWK